MTQPDAQNAKKLLRTQLSAARQSLAKDPTAGAGLEQTTLELARHLGATLIAAYLPFGTEPNLTQFVVGAAGHGISLIMPVSTADGTLRWVTYTGKSEPGIFGFEEPVGPDAKLSDAHLVLIPASAVDLRGNRLGKGKGYYDIALADPAISAPVAAVVYDAEVLDEIPAEEHDQPVAFVITPARLIEI